VVGVRVRRDHEVELGDAEPLERGGQIDAGTCIDEGRLTLGSPYDDGIALADVEEDDLHRARLGAAARWQREGQESCEAETAEVSVHLEQTARLLLTSASKS
jgi:hypothetical protein